MRRPRILAAAIIASILLMPVLGCPHSSGEYFQEILGKGHPRLTPQWSPDGVHIVFSHKRTGTRLPSDVYLSASDGTMLRQVFKAETGSSADIGTYYSSPNISADGSRIAYATTRVWESEDQDVTDDWEIETSRLDGSDRRRLTMNERLDTFPVWSPDDSRIAFMRDLTGSTRVAQDRGVYTMSADGSDKRLVMRFRDAREERTVIDWADEEHSLSWSPDGTLLAFVVKELDRRASDPISREILYTMRADGSGLTRAFEASNTARYHLIFGGPEWSPDGRKIAFMALKFLQPVRLYTISPSGLGIRIVVELGYHETVLAPGLSWSPDGRKILFSAGYIVRRVPPYVDPHTIDEIDTPRSTESGESLYESTIYVVDDESDPVTADPLAVAEGTHASWSPDGSRIAVYNEHAPTGAPVLSTVSPDGSDVRVLVRRDGDSLKAENARCFLFFCW